MCHYALGTHIRAFERGCEIHSLSLDKHRPHWKIPQERSLQRKQMYLNLLKKWHKINEKIQTIEQDTDYLLYQNMILKSFKGIVMCLNAYQVDCNVGLANKNNIAILSIKIL